MLPKPNACAWWNRSRPRRKRFNDLLPKYKANPALFANILLSEKIGQVLTNVQDKIYLPERADGKTRELRLQLSREPQKPAAQQRRRTNKVCMQVTRF